MRNVFTSCERLLIPVAVWARCLVLIFFASYLGQATDDSAVLGVYRIGCRGIAGTFKITNDGVREIRLNGKGFPDTDLGAFGRHGFIGTYEFDLEGSRTGKSIRLFLLFDEGDRVRAITGFYLRTAAKAGRENDPYLAEACSLQVGRVGARGR